MHCSTAAGQQRAAQEALSISEYELQRIKQQGCFTTAQDRAIMRNPDYRALPYPALANPILSLEFDTNNKYTAINQAEGFTSPFIDGVTNQRVEVRPTVPGLSMAGTGDLAAISGAFLNSEPEEKATIYARIADSIRGAPPKISEESPTRQGVDEAALRLMAMEESSVAQLQPITSASQISARGLYGDASPQPHAEGAPSPDFFERCKTQCRAALYDLMHYESIAQDQLEAAKCRSRLTYVATREGRLPYLLLVMTALLLTAYIVFLMLRR
jgi:hypothetical protein